MAKPEFDEQTKHGNTKVDENANLKGEIMYSGKESIPCPARDIRP